MRILFYIWIFIFIFSCQKNKETVLEEVAAESVEEYQETERSKDSTDVVEFKKFNNKTNEDFIRQQLQEIVNLIALKNSVDLNEELATELTETISQKVKTYQIDADLGVIELQNLEIVQQHNTENTSQIKITFEVKNSENKIFSGNTKAEIITNSVEIDNEIFTDYRIYFLEIAISK